MLVIICGTLRNGLSEEDPDFSGSSVVMQYADSEPNWSKSRSVSIFLEVKLGRETLSLADSLVNSAFFYL